jgi:hypothetical protein
MKSKILQLSSIPKTIKRHFSMLGKIIQKKINI